MPSPNGKTPRIPRCSYKEGGRRCIRNAIGDSNPPLCNTHRVMFADIGKPSQARPGQGLVDVIGDLLNGDKVSRDRLEQAAAEVFGGGWNLGGFMAGGYSPEIPHVPPNNNQGFNNPPPPRWWRRQQVDPLELELAEARRGARVVLGFAATEPITIDQLKATHRKLVVANHPDRAKDDTDRRRRTEKMMNINAANDILLAELDPERAQRKEQA